MEMEAAKNSKYAFIGLSLTPVLPWLEIVAKFFPEVRMC